MEHGFIIEIAVCIIAAWVLAVVCQVARQPLLLAYLGAGFLIGPNGFKWITNPESIKTIANLGLIFLLFLIGLEMDLRKMFSAGKAILIAAAVQILGCTFLGWLVFQATHLGGTWLASLYLAVAAAMSSTVIIVKLLHDKHELETLAGRITLGILVMQDLFVILFLAIQPNLKNPALAPLFLAFGKVLLLVGVSYLISRFLLPPVFRLVAHQPELVLVGALAWCFAMAGFADTLKLSREMGALIAGVMVSTFPYALDLVPRVTSIRDFFVTLFFVGLGMSIPLPTWDLVLLMFLLSLFLIGSRLLTVFLPLYRMGLGHRISLLPAINLCQMSELSLVLLTLGMATGDVPANLVNVAAFSFVFLAVDSTYAIARSDQILRKASPWLAKLGYPDTMRSESVAPTESTPPVFILGCWRSASSLIEGIGRDEPARLSQMRVVDFNPRVIQALGKRGVQVVYGDISQLDTLRHAGVTHASVIVCSLPDSILKGADNLRLLRQVRGVAPKACIIMHAERLDQVPKLYEAGADYVIVSRLLEAAHMMEVLTAAEKGLLGEERERQLAQLEGRKEVLP